mmetsp:Transcript_21287/g.40430  ORF Transcript_21287/g.40430 Transcript_21287/m.40430 type:complete len:296 (+) Transcript_21287:303-1190(+)
MTRLTYFYAMMLCAWLMTEQTQGFVPSSTSSLRHESSASASASTSTFTRQPPPQTQTYRSSTSTTALPAIRRRETFSRLKRAVLAGIGLSTVSKWEQQAASAAEDEALEPGKIVTLEVDNLEGQPGNTGIIKIQLQPSWAPRGVERFEQLTASGFWDGCRIFRVIPGFIAQFGINGDPTVQAKWRGQNLKDDPVKVTNARGTVVFATAGPNSRTTQIFINTREQGNAFLDNQGFSPIGKVIEGMDVADKLYAGYGEGAPAGKGPNQAKIQLQGNAYLTEQFPKLSFFRKATLVDP